MNTECNFEKWKNSSKMTGFFREQKAKIVQVEKFGDIEFGRFTLKDSRGIELKTISGTEFILYFELFYIEKRISSVSFAQFQENIFKDFSEGKMLNLIDGILLQFLSEHFLKDYDVLKGMVHSSLLAERLKSSLANAEDAPKKKVRL